MKLGWKDVAARIVVVSSAAIITATFIYILYSLYSSYPQSAWLPLVPSVVASWFGVVWVFRGAKSEASIFMRMGISILGAWVLFTPALMWAFFSAFAGAL